MRFGVSGRRLGTKPPNNTRNARAGSHGRRRGCTVGLYAWRTPTLYCCTGSRSIYSAPASLTALFIGRGSIYRVPDDQAVHGVEDRLADRVHRVPHSHLRPVAVPHSHLRPVAVPHSHSRPIAVPHSHLRPITVPHSHLRPSRASDWVDLGGFRGFRCRYRNTAAMAEFLEKELGLAADSPGA